MAQSHGACVQQVAGTHIHAGWSSFRRYTMGAADSNEWRIELEVPAGQQEIRVNDPNACVSDPNGAVTANVFANGVRLTRVVTTPGNGPEPGLAFTLAANGTVTP